MKLATFDAGSGPQTGIVVGETIIPTGHAGDMIGLIRAWDVLGAALDAKAAGEAGIPLTEVELLAPVPRPGKIFAIGLNYADHIAESKMETPEHQLWFTKASTSVNPPFRPIEIAKGTGAVDYEVELVAVIGRGGRHIPVDKAKDHVFGYCVGNDVTERVWQHRTRQWCLGKSFDTHAPFGPWITTADEVADPHALGIQCLVNGTVRQDSNTRHLVFNIWEQIEHLSTAMTLEPGDIIFTGTPGGVGAAMSPKCFLQPGDVVRCELDQLGAIEARVEAEA